MLPVTTNIREAYQRGTDDEQMFIQNLSLFLCTFLKEHAQLIEKKNDLTEALMEVSITLSQPGFLKPDQGGSERVQHRGAMKYPELCSTF